MEFYFGTNGEGSLGVDRRLRVEPCGSVVVTSTTAIVQLRRRHRHRRRSAIHPEAVVVQKSRILPHAVGPGMAGLLRGPDCARRSTVSPRRVLPLKIRDFCSSTSVVFVHSVPGWP
jgi:hypothetical protein